MNKLVEKCAERIFAKKMTIAFAESATAGRLASEFSLTSVSGEILKGGIVCYDVCVKEDILHVPHQLIDRYTPESAEVTEELARQLKRFMPADICVGVTGLTTPGGSETPDKPVGTMFIHLLIKDKSVSHRVVFGGSALNIINKTIEEVTKMISQHIIDREQDF
jgi:nicotinamide-nucleotide amidase